MLKLHVLSTILLLLFAREGAACSCAAPPPPAKALERAHAVFSGVVREIERDKRLLRVAIEVERSWKGEKARPLEVSTSASEASCGFGFRVGKSYVVYAYESEGGALRTSLCSRTRLKDRAAEDLEALGPGEIPAN